MQIINSEYQCTSARDTYNFYVTFSNFHIRINKDKMLKNIETNY